MRCLFVHKDPHMLEWFAKIGAFFSSPLVMLSVVIVGLLFHHQKRKIYGWALCLVLFTMIYNYFLKSLWQSPLPPPLVGWAFPSGHMHSAFVFWGWLACEYRKVGVYALTFFILCSVGYSLIYNGYHYPSDILGAIGFGSLSLIVMRLITPLPFFDKKPYCLGYLFILIGSILIFFLPQGSLKPHLWQALGGLIFTSFIWTLSYTKIFKQKRQGSSVARSTLEG